MTLVPSIGRNAGSVSISCLLCVPELALADLCKMTNQLYKKYFLLKQNKQGKIYAINIKNKTFLSNSNLLTLNL